MSATLIAKLAFKSTSLSNLNSSILDFSSLLHFSPWNCGGSPKWYEYQIETVRQCRNEDEHMVSNAVRTRLWFQMSWDLVVFCCWYIYQANIAHPRSNQYWLHEEISNKLSAQIKLHYYALSHIRCTFSDRSMKSWWKTETGWIKCCAFDTRDWLGPFTVMGFWFLLITISICDHNQNWYP